MAQRFYNIDKDATVSFKEALYSGLVGAMSGFAMASGTSAISSAVKINAGNKVKANGNVDTLLKMADAVSNEFKSSNFNKSLNPFKADARMNELIQNLQASTRAYQKMTPEAQNSARGSLVLGEIQTAMTMIESTQAVGIEQQKVIANAQLYADYANQMTDGKTNYTAQDIEQNKNNIATQLAVMRYAREMLTPGETTIAREAINEAIFRETGVRQDVINRNIQNGMSVDEAVRKADAESNAGTKNITEYDPENPVDTYKVYGNGVINIVEDYGENNELEGYTVFYPTGKIEADGQYQVERETFANKEELSSFIGEQINKYRAQQIKGEFAEDSTAQNNEATSEKESSQVNNTSKEENATESKKSSEKKMSLKDTISNIVNKKTNLSQEQIKNNQQRAALQDKARKAVKGYDLLDVERRIAIENMFLTADASKADIKAANAAAELMSVFKGLNIGFANMTQNGFHILEDGIDIIVLNSNVKAGEVISRAMFHESLHSVQDLIKQMDAVGKAPVSEDGEEITITDDNIIYYNNKIFKSEYDRLVSACKKLYGETNQKEIREKYRKYAEENNLEWSDEYIESEVDAEAVGYVLAKGDFIERLQNNAPVIEFIKSIRRWGRLLKRADARVINTMTARYMSTITMDNASRALLERYGALASEINTSNGKMYNLTTLNTPDESGKTGWEKLEDYLTKLPVEQADQIRTGLEDIEKMTERLTEGNAAFDNWQQAEIRVNESGKPFLSVVVKNGDYKLNLDMSTVCKKRVALDTVLNSLATDPLFKDEFSNLTKNDLMDIREILRDYGYEIACQMCFVDAKRYMVGEWADDFAERYNRVLRLITKQKKHEYFDFAKKGMAYEENGDRASYTDVDTEVDDAEVENLLKRISAKSAADQQINEIRQKLEGDLTSEERDSLERQLLSVKMSKNDREKLTDYRIAKFIQANKNARRLLNGNDMISSYGLAEVKRFSEQLYGIMLGNFGSGTPKPSLNATPYANEVLTMKIFNAAEAFSIGGVRLQSFSDYVANMVLDYAQIFADLSAKGLPLQAYTKEIDFAMLFGLTGAKINLSLVPAVAFSPEVNSIWKDGEKRINMSKISDEQLNTICKVEGVGNWEDRIAPIYDGSLTVNGTTYTLSEEDSKKFQKSHNLTELSREGRATIYSLFDWSKLSDKVRSKIYQDIKSNLNKRKDIVAEQKIAGLRPKKVDVKFNPDSRNYTVTWKESDGKTYSETVEKAGLDLGYNRWVKKYSDAAKARGNEIVPFATWQDL